MIPTMQTKLHEPPKQKGNCFAASFASIFEIQIEDVPEFEDMPADKWWPSVTRWLKMIGFECLIWNHPIVLEGYYFVAGTSPRDQTVDHQVIYKQGRMVHDPHPSGDGILDEKEFMVFVPLDPAAALRGIEEDQI